ncbi:hypothetical protein [Paenibacillus sp. PAMC21692]|uniref:hypothetical protein n=1 Tax=Paenibacillus sp. PAMC21692 TaxID=2762320 RepID=UPI00164D8BC7|nr:hypothetical protein [Paenibacillus sp. PAMC21692]QNK57423.1 hypothetical protein H7F31_33995 [Paenibacillus sp. PAMC21692]
MGGKAKANHPDYLTRVDAARDISFALTNDPDPEHDNVHIAYRRIGSAVSDGTIVAHSVAGGRTKQFYKPDLQRFAKETYGIEVPTFKVAERNNSSDTHDDNGENEEDINDHLLIQEFSQVISWYEDDILTLETAASTLRNLIKKYSNSI